MQSIDLLSMDRCPLTFYDRARRQTNNSGDMRSTMGQPSLPRSLPAQSNTRCSKLARRQHEPEVVSCRPMLNLWRPKSGTLVLSLEISATISTGEQLVRATRLETEMEQYEHAISTPARGVVEAGPNFPCQPRSKGSFSFADSRS